MRSGSRGSRWLKEGRRNWRGAAVSTALLTCAIASAAQGEQCIAAANFNWSGPSQGGWIGCIPDASDDFSMNGFTVTLAADLSIAGSLAVTAGGRLVVPAGVTLTATGGVRVDDGGTLELSGATLHTGRVASVVWSGSTATLSVDDLPPATLAPGDYVHFTDDYGAPGAVLAEPLQSFADPPLPGTTRPAYARGWMFRVVTVVGTAVTVSLDDWAGVGFRTSARGALPGRRSISPARRRPRAFTAA
ncbi:MAG: hypothetical protein AAF430_19675 [Myxococcota bacterium]